MGKPRKSDIVRKSAKIRSENLGSRITGGKKKICFPPKKLGGGPELVGPRKMKKAHDWALTTIR